MPVQGISFTTTHVGEYITLNPGSSASKRAWATSRCTSWIDILPGILGALDTYSEEDWYSPKSLCEGINGQRGEQTVNIFVVGYTYITVSLLWVGVRHISEWEDEHC